MGSGSPVNIEAKQKGLHSALDTIPSHVTLVPINFMTQDLGMVLNEHGYSGGKKTFFNFLFHSRIGIIVHALLIKTKDLSFIWS